VNWVCLLREVSADLHTPEAVRPLPRAARDPAAGEPPQRISRGLHGHHARVLCPL